MELPTRYDPHEHEEAIYARWLASGAFQPPATPSGRGAFTIMIPPPNVTGALHMGHALNGTIQDIIIRHRRMCGLDTLWVPGTDHAGIATQAVVERELLASEKKTRQDLGREAFLERVWRWKEVHGNKILEQFRRLGASCDWSRTRFTLEPELSRAVRESFVRLWERGLVYRGARLVNWDCVLQTAVSDDEVEHVTRKGKLYYLRYPVEAQSGVHVTVATTRPETMLADSGVAVHPSDERYRALVGQLVRLPLVDRLVPIVADESVDPAFGTGAVKVTPGHDPADYERGERHGLAVLNILEKDGTLAPSAGVYAGLPREKARERVVADFDALGLLERVLDIEHNVALSDRSKSVIEPIISEQWFVRMQRLAEPAIRAVQSGRLEIRPERWTKVYLDWLHNVRDWCISRQLWWGHRIPVWYDENGVPVASREDLELGAPHPQTGKPIVRQDDDVLDTWASSWLWPFATLGWPERTADLARFYPTQFLSTAREIIYLWVARMVMAGYEFLDHLPEAERCPFATCYIHATVLDGKGRRMSKSAGNGIDPLDMIATYGADAVRFSLVRLTREGQDVKLAESRFEDGRRFANKVWNATRFVCMNLAGERSGGTSAEAVRLEDRWILSRLARVRAEVSAWLDAYQLNDAIGALYDFFWDDFCACYVELAKNRMVDAGESGRAARGTLARVLRDSLALLHPFVPFQTEVLWGALHEALGVAPASLLVSAPWPDGAGLARDEEAEAQMALVQGVVRAVRNIRALTCVDERKALRALVAAPREHERTVLAEHAETIRALANLTSLEVHAAVERPPSSVVDVVGAVEVIVLLSGELDLDGLRETWRRRIEKLKKGIASIDGKLANQSFVERADPDVVAQERARREEMVLELALLERNLAGL